MPGYAMRVERLDPGQVLVIRSSNHAWVWSFELRPVNGRTRLISRNRFDTAALPMRDKLAYPIIEPGSWVMERKMLLTIKQRAEQLGHCKPGHRRNGNHADLTFAPPPPDQRPCSHPSSGTRLIDGT